MPRPAKTVTAITGHRTKAEIELRKEAEKQLLTGVDITERAETKKNKVAHTEFLRVVKLFELLKKNDDLYTAIINRYCIMQAECLEFEKLKTEYSKTIKEFTQDKEKIVEDYVKNTKKETISLTQYYKMKSNFSKTILSLDAAIMSKRKMLFDIEKENLMTVASALRSIPKTPPSQTKNPLLGVLNDDASNL